MCLRASVSILNGIGAGPIGAQAGRLLPEIDQIVFTGSVPYRAGDPARSGGSGDTLTLMELGRQIGG